MTPIASRTSTHAARASITHAETSARFRNAAALGGLISIMAVSACASSPPPSGPTPQSNPNDAANTSDKGPLAFVYERRLSDDDIFLDYFLPKVDGQPWRDAPVRPGRHVVQVEARFGRLQEQQGIVLKKNAVVEVKPGRSMGVHFVVKDGEGQSLSGQVDADIFVKVAESESMTAADPLPQDGPVAQKLKTVPIGLPPEVARLSGKYNLVKLCMTARGAVDFVQLLSPLHPSFDGALLDTTSRWAFKPMEIEGAAVPFCVVQKNLVP